MGPRHGLNTRDPSRAWFFVSVHLTAILRHAQEGFWRTGLWLPGFAGPFIGLSPSQPVRRRFGPLGKREVLTLGLLVSFFHEAKLQQASPCLWTNWFGPLPVSGQGSPLLSDKVMKSHLRMISIGEHPILCGGHKSHGSISNYNTCPLCWARRNFSNKLVLMVP